MAENKLKETFKERYERQAKELGQEKRQAVLDMIKSGETLGEVSRFFNIDLMVTCEILTQNIKNVSYLGNEAI